MEIQLTKGQVTIVDDRDYKWLTEMGSWYANPANGFKTYAARSETKPNGKRRLLYMHRAIWEHHNGEIPKGLQIDHINQDRLDNRLSNLRLATPSQNGMNAHKYSTNTSGFKGVTWRRAAKKWQAQLMVGTKNTSLGFYSCLHCAATAYNEAATKYHGEFAKVNDIPKDMQCSDNHTKSDFGDHINTGLLVQTSGAIW